MMSLSPGTTLGPYEILAPLGEGGMGEVYRAHDTKLKRDVAIKVLPAAFTADKDRLARFEREAQLLAQLHHPNIASIFGLEESAGVRALVMELVEGPTLAERLASGPLSLTESLSIALQIAQALEEAHEKGIVHRDLKPQNIKAAVEGKVKVLDFGLAKAMDAAAGASSAADLARSPTLMQSPTLTAVQGTQLGMILGTAAYMSPEQARGGAVDKRADIWAFGVVLYEMLTGRSAFAADTVPDTLAAVLTREVDWTALPAATPAALRDLLRRCLERKPKNRLHDIADARIALDDLLSGRLAAASPPGSALQGAPRAGWPTRLAWLGAGLALGALAFAGYFGRARPVATAASVAEVTYKPVTFEEGFVFAARFAPDGRTIVYSADWDRQPRGVFVTSLDSPESRALGFPGADLLAVSRSGELAILRDSTLPEGNPYVRSGTLARASLTGGAPRSEMERVLFADFGANTTMAVVQGDERRQTVQYPAGQVLAEALLLEASSSSFSAKLQCPRVSPSGDYVAFFDSRAPNADKVKIFDRSGKFVTESRAFSDWWGLAWSPTNEVWYAAAENSGRQTTVFSLDLLGRQRVVFRAPGALTLHDLSPQGEMLASFDQVVGRVELVDGDNPAPQDRTWREGGSLVAFSDSHALLINESGDSGGPNGSVFVWQPKEPQPVRIADGNGRALSPDGSKALVESFATPPRVSIVPTGAGLPQLLDLGPIELVTWAGWLPDGRILIGLVRPGSQAVVYAAATAGGDPVALLPAGVTLRGRNLISPDGSRIAAIDAGGRLVTCAIATPACQAVPGARDGDEVAGWSADGKSLFVFQRQQDPVQVDRLEVASGRRSAWRTVRPLYAAVGGFSDLFASPDGALAYDYSKDRSALYVIRGLR